MSKDNEDVLKDGAVLKELAHRFIDNPSVETIGPVISCLIDSSYLQVPMNLIMTDEDKELLKKVNTGDTFHLNNDVRMRPDYLQDPETEKLYFPIFSSVEEAGEDYSKHFSWINLDIDTCIDFVEHNENCSGILLNAFTTPIVIEDELYNILKKKMKETRKED